MKCVDFLTTLAALFSTGYCQSPVASSKRGLVHVPSQQYPQDDAIWDAPNSDLSWYYNYQSKPSPAFADNSKFEFVPMLWGSSSSFLSDVQSQIKAGANITYVLGFNEPDGDSSTYVFRRDLCIYGHATHRKTCQMMLTLKHLISGGSEIPAETAAQIWMRQMEPLAKQGVKLGAPACTGAETGLQWTQDFFKACINCTIDFIPVHVCKISLKILPAGCPPGK